MLNRMTKPMPWPMCHHTMQPADRPVNTYSAPMAATVHSCIDPKMGFYTVKTEEESRKEKTDFAIHPGTGSTTGGQCQCQCQCQFKIIDLQGRVSKLETDPSGITMDARGLISSNKFFYWDSVVITTDKNKDEGSVRACLAELGLHALDIGLLTRTERPDRSTKSWLIDIRWKDRVKFFKAAPDLKRKQLGVKNREAPVASLSAIKAKGGKHPRTEPVYGLTYSASPSRLDRSHNQAPAPRDPRPSSAAGRTMDIDGFITTSGRRSSKDQDRDGHVTLVLGLAVGGTGTSAKGCCQKKRAVFEISRYRDYAALFTDGSQVMHALNGVIIDLSNGACNSTESVERISTLLRKVLIRVFAGRRPEGMQAGGGALWWNEECQSVRQHMLACRVRLGPGRVENKSGPLWEAFCKARNAMNRAKRRARAAYDAERMREFVVRCRHDQRALWRALGGQLKERCAIDDLHVFRDHFATLLNAGVGETGVEVTLVLGLAVGGTGTSAKGCCQKKRAVFEISRYRDYAALFTDGSQVMHALNGVIIDLSNGACNSTESVERISTLLRKGRE
ncbi:hypothetical protein VOLCADRAFT_92548 [Volvox carteri f. nagariensis]|uniref:Uncharacterized protein n=1 Tax=Volvox carteri f. nagariensis TaxID=3068 RepID=D8TZY2_VOLCA|nr:uncharacterized protein VOLCADRAFT_92548 [Volvox carteri f. nagariensis]EFJ47010.1 hypothetical protein VOLCADRAFT_92548 [Volvox carteri f. nagariensis]|eukprot:XP_002951905.1 hypothetical protein VOLCADRAFT_92548 [Volvox carteri f. nagariensis]